MGKGFWRLYIFAVAKHSNYIQMDNELLLKSAQELYKSLSIPENFNSYQRLQLLLGCAHSILENNPIDTKAAALIYLRSIQNFPQMEVPPIAGFSATLP